jgi:hypothetical protein
VWVEVKGGTAYGLTPMQRQFKTRLMDSNPNRYFVLDTKEDLERLIAICKCYISEGLVIRELESRAVAKHYTQFKDNPDVPIDNLRMDELMEVLK